MDKPTIAILLTFAVHVLGLVVLFWLALDGARLDWRGWWPGDDGRGGGEPPADPPPLPDGDPAAVRLRTEHDRLGAARRVRRPAHPPQPARTREPA